MSVVEIKEQISGLSLSELTEVSEHAAMLRKTKDPEYLAELARRLDEVKRGVNVVREEQVRELLRARGIDC